MQDTEFCQQVLGLGKPWRVKALKLELAARRVKYADGSVQEVAVPWTEHFSRLTRLMKAFVIRVLQDSRSVSEAGGPARAVAARGLAHALCWD